MTPHLLPMALLLLSCSHAAAQAPVIPDLLRRLDTTLNHNDFRQCPRPGWILRRLETFRQELAALGECEPVTGSVPDDTDGKATIVSRPEDLPAALAAAPCGRTVTLAFDRYDPPLAIDAGCTAAEPLVIVPATRTVLAGRVTLSGSGITLRGLDFDGPASGVTVHGDHHRILAGRFAGWAGMAILLLDGTGAEIAWNAFHDPAPWGLAGDPDYPLRIAIRSSHRPAEFHTGAHIHHNHFHDFPGKPSADYHSGQSDAIEVCFTGTMLESGFLIESNLIERHHGSSGIVDIKCSKATVRDNTVLDSPAGRIDLRYGANSRLEGNWIENAGGSVIRGGHHTIAGNVYRNTSQGLVIAAGNDPWDATGGQAEPQAFDVTLSGNETDQLTVGEDYGSMKRPATDTTVHPLGSERICLKVQAGTRILEPAVPALAARRIGEDEVGPDAFASQP
ncbi:MAG: right-handed parallel beta-helix repeat-containing protein [Geminicoccaceae bacterium]|nr:right-handed parallel beta-helix repeat-containing protein [Geminicoccaceae bacterium]